MPRLVHWIASLVLAATLSLSAGARAENFSGLWWNSPAGSESGWGITFEHQGDTIFATWFTYDPDGQPWWLAATLRRVDFSLYEGDVFTTTGPAFSAVPFNPKEVKETTVGTMRLTFTGSQAGALAYTVNGISQTKPIVRQLFGGDPVCYRGVANYAHRTDSAYYVNTLVTKGIETGSLRSVQSDANTYFMAAWSSAPVMENPLLVGYATSDLPAGRYGIVTGAIPGFMTGDPIRVTGSPAEGFTLYNFRSLLSAYFAPSKASPSLPCTSATGAYDGYLGGTGGYLVTINRAGAGFIAANPKAPNAPMFSIGWQDTVGRVVGVAPPLPFSWGQATEAYTVNIVDTGSNSLAFALISPEQRVIDLLVFGQSN